MIKSEMPWVGNKLEMTMINLGRERTSQEKITYTEMVSYVQNIIDSQPRRKPLTESDDYDGEY